MTYSREEAAKFAGFIKGLGFRVYLAKQGDYGFITDDKAERVLSFSFGYDQSLGGNYGPPSQKSGTGWKMGQSPYNLKTKEQIRDALYAVAPRWAGDGWKHYTTVKQHLAMYGSSSGYQEI